MEQSAVEDRPAIDIPLSPTTTSLLGNLKVYWVIQVYWVIH